MELQASSLRVYKPKPVRASTYASPIKSFTQINECNPFSLQASCDTSLPKLRKSRSSNNENSTCAQVDKLGRLETKEDDELRIRVQIEREMIVRSLLAFPRPSCNPIHDLSSVNPYTDEFSSIPMVKSKSCCSGEKQFDAPSRPSNPMVKDNLWAEQSEPSTDEDRE